MPEAPVEGGHRRLTAAARQASSMARFATSLGHDGSKAIQEHPCPKFLSPTRFRPPPSRSSRTAASRSTFSRTSARTRTSSPKRSTASTGSPIRSATKVTPKILERARNLKVIGRAGIGVDNVDIPAATARGIIVMNTPFGNSITTAEHAITLMLSLARQIPEADASTRAGKWEKNKFLGVEIFGKTLGVIGCGNIGSIVADRGARHEDEGDRLRSVPLRRARDRSRRRKSRARRAVAPRRFHHPAHAADRQDPQHHQCRQPQAGEEKPAADQLRARRAGRRGGPVRRAVRPDTSPAPRSTCSSPSRRARARCLRCRTSSARRISAPPPPRRRRMWRCRSPSRWPSIWCAAPSPTR